MANDGSQAPAWTGQAFSYLPYHRESTRHSTYASAPAPGPSPAQQRQNGNVGTWSGPAPTGFLRAQAAEGVTAPAAIVPNPDYVLLRTGHRIPLLGYGTYKVQTSDAVRDAIKAGYRHFDCAAIYGNEALMGEGLQDFIAGGHRSDLFVTSKVWNTDHHPDAVRRSCKQSIKDLGCEYLDLYLVHWPDAWKPGTKDADTSIPIEQTWQAMESLVDAGLVRTIGVSNFNISEVEHLLTKARIPPAVNQVELHPLLSQRKLVGTCSRKGLHMTAYSPLGHAEPDVVSNKVVEEIAEATGHTPAQVVLRWNVQRGMSVIPRSNNPANIASNIADLFSWHLSNEHKARLDSLDCGHRTVDNDWHDWDRIVQ